MKRLLLSFLLFFAAFQSVLAQVSYGGEPARWSDKAVTNEISFISMPAISLEQLQQEDMVVDQVKEAPYRFGVEFPVNLTPENSGVVFFDEQTLRKHWFLGLECSGARSINLIFSQFNLKKGATLFIWSADREEFLGSFTEKNNNINDVLGTSVLHGDRIVVELSAPVDVFDQCILEIGTVVHGYRPVLANHFFDTPDRGPYGSSGACNNNINCPEGADWQVEKRSVALILSGGSALCTGALVNNTANDGTPYFLTANHCYSNTVGSWVFVFNHESTTCAGTTGPTNQTVSGSTLVAKNAGSDFCLLLLNSTPPASYNVQYSGWDASDATTVTSATGIHHPSGDLKKISFENDALSQGTWSGAQTWDVAQWDDGITEPGSSGSPLFDQNHRIIGQLYGGGSACNGAVENGQGDSYGRFGISWNTGTTAATRLHDWLDPSNTGVVILDGYPDGFTPLALDAIAGGIAGLLATSCNSNVSPQFTLVNQGSTTLTTCQIQYTWNGGAVQTYNWTGSLTQGNSTVIDLPSTVLTSGINTLVVTVVSPNNGTDENTNNNSVSFVTTIIDSGISSAIPYSNDFAQTGFPYSGWQTSNPDGGVTWEYSNVNIGGGVLKYDCYNYDVTGELDELTTAPFNLAGAADASLKFKVAHREYSASYTDGLIVEVSTSCDGPWNEVYNKSGTNLATASNSTNEYLQPAAADWRQECVDLTPYINNASLFVKFIGVNGYGNCIYLDDLEMSNTNCSGGIQVEELVFSNPTIQVYPNPALDETIVAFQQSQSGKLSIQLIDLLGQVVDQKNITSTVGLNRVKFDVTHLSKGMYFVQIVGDIAPLMTKIQVK